MSVLSTKSKELKIFNFGLPLDLYKEFDEVSSYLNSPKSELLRNAIRNIVETSKKKRIQQELKEAYIANNDLLEKEAEDWDYVSVEGMNDL